MPRIVSLVPSLSQTVHALGLGEALVGITKFCVMPTSLARHAALVGGTKDPDLAQIAALAPTHILVNSEENKPEHIAACQGIAPTLVSFPKSPWDVVPLLRELGSFLCIEGAAEAEAQALAKALEDGQTKGSGMERERELRYAYFIWQRPYMLAGADTYIAETLRLAGLQNISAGAGRYPAVSLSEVQSLKPEVLLLANEPFPFRKRHAALIRQEWPDAPPIYKIDGQLLSWFGALTRDAVRHMQLIKDTLAQSGRLPGHYPLTLLPLGSERQLD